MITSSVVVFLRQHIQVEVPMSETRYMVSKLPVNQGIFLSSVVDSKTPLIPD